MRTSSTNKKIRELITLVKSEQIIPRPEFQRRLVWSREDKNHFIDSVLNGFPFPEIYLADGEVDLDSGAGSQLLVDGLQRISTLVQYFDGDSTLRLTTVPPYADLNETQKRDFLQYDVSVRDLGTISKAQIVEAFKRLNATKYSLLDIEVNNAIYSGKLKKFAEDLASTDFFINHNVFNSLDFKRMGDLRFTLTIIGTMIEGYFNRDDAFEELLSRYNDDFLVEDEIKIRFDRARSFIEELALDEKCRAWKKADLLSLIVELDYILSSEKSHLNPSDAVERLVEFYNTVESSAINEPTIYSIYYKAALQASNDRINRLRRGIIIHGVLLGDDVERILADLRSQGL